MSISELKQNLQEDFLEGPIPICEIHTERDIEKWLTFMHEDYRFTEAEWKERFPSIDSGKVFYTPAYFGSVFYYDADIPCVVSLMQVLAQPDTMLDGFHEMIEQLAKYRKRGEYLKLLRPVGGATAIHLLRDIILRQRPTGKLYETLLNLYIQYDIGAGLLAPDIWKSLAAKKTGPQQERTLKAVSDLPGELVIYRGEGSVSTPASKVFSWTLDEMVAYRFALFGLSGSYRIVTAKVRRDDILEYIKSCGEREAIVLPEHVYDKRVRTLFSVEELVKSKEAPYHAAELVIDALRDNAELYGDLESEMHGKQHMFRVTLLAAYLAEHEKVKGLLSELLLAAAIHDCGRVDDAIDPQHGRTSYERYLEAAGKDEAHVRFLVTYHCVDDKEAKGALERADDIDDKTELWKAYRVLKDADALDRVRLAYGEDGLDVSHLRFPYSKRLVAFALEMAQVYQII